MKVIIEEAKACDAEAMVEYLKIIGSESDNLSFGAEGLGVSIEDEEKYIESMALSENSVQLTAKIDGEIVGDISLRGNSRERFKHRGEIGLSVRKEYWNMGIGTALLERAVQFAKNTAGLEILSLEVRSDNTRAIHLYEKFGFKKIGQFNGFMKIDGKYADCDIMVLEL